MSFPLPRRSRVAAALAASALTASFIVATPLATHADADPGVLVVDAWNVTSPATFPELGGGVLPTYRPAMTQAPNGDLLVGFNTSTDAAPGGQLRLIRSTDEGLTWGPSEIIATPSLFPNGSIHLQRGMTTLSDGTILLPYNDSVNNVQFTDRQAALFVARSTDNGHTWTGQDEPIDLPVPFRELWGGGGRVLELADGSLVQPVWGIRELPADWQTDPNRYEAGVLISRDGGLTWPEYNQVLQDPHSPPYLAWGFLFPGGANESTIEVLPDGSLRAFVRFETTVGGGAGRFYMSTSTDGGSTWSPAVTSTLQASTISVTTSPCTPHLADGKSKLILGYRGGGSIATMSVSFDEGETFVSAVRLKDPNTNNTLSQSAEPDYFHRSDGKILTIFQLQTGTAPFRLVANLLEDTSDTAACQTESAASAATATATPTFVIERADRDRWFLPMSNVRVTHPSTRTVGAVIAAHAQALVCLPSDNLVLTNELGTVLDPSLTLAAAGVKHGDVLQLSGTSAVNASYRIGYTELDTAPADRSVANWDDACAPARFAFDFRNRSLGFELTAPAGQVATAIELRDEDTTSRLNASSYRLFSSSDNQSYTEITGWQFSSRIENGHLIHRFDNFATTDRYLKVAQNQSNDAFTFTFGSARADAIVLFTDTEVDARKDAVVNGATAEVGTTIDYTLSFENTGTIVAPIDAVDDLRDVLDDADVNETITVSAGLNASRDGNRILVSGTVPAGTTGTVTYSATIRDAADRSNHTVTNYLHSANEALPNECSGSAICTRTDLPVIGFSKSSTPGAGATAIAGQTVEYEVTLTNTGGGAGSIDVLDDLSDVLDDAEMLPDTITSSDPAVDAELVTEGLRITGTLGANGSATITYTVRVDDPPMGNGVLRSFLASDPAETCANDNPLCTTHTIGETAPPAAQLNNAAPSSLAGTGTQPVEALGLALLALCAGMVTVGSVRARQRMVTAHE